MTPLEAVVALAAVIVREQEGPMTYDLERRRLQRTVSEISSTDLLEIAADALVLSTRCALQFEQRKKSETNPALARIFGAFTAPTDPDDEFVKPRHLAAVRS